MVTMRSSSGIKLDSMFSRVVLPLPVPPQTTTLALALTQASKKPSIPKEADPKSIRFSARSGTLENLRMVMVGPLSAKGGMIAFTREPSFSLASTMGLASSQRRPIGVTIRLIKSSTCLSSRSLISVRSSLPLRST